MPEEIQSIGNAIIGWPAVIVHTCSDLGGAVAERIRCDKFPRLSTIYGAPDLQCGHASGRRVHDAHEQPTSDAVASYTVDIFSAAIHVSKHLAARPCCAVVVGGQYLPIPV